MRTAMPRPAVTSRSSKFWTYPAFANLRSGLLVPPGLFSYARDDPDPQRLEDGSF